MTVRLYWIIGLIVAVLVIGFGAMWVVRGSQQTQSVATVTDFTSCAAVGYPIMESYPRQCRTPDGRTFVEQISISEPLSDRIQVTAPLADAVVASPLTVTGKARGTWYFEASFPVRILDANNQELGVIPAAAQGEWMTEDFVPFSATLAFTAPTTATGTLVFEKDNPSGLPENDAALRVPVRFVP